MQKRLERDGRSKNPSGSQASIAAISGLNQEEGTGPQPARRHNTDRIQPEHAFDVRLYEEHRHLCAALCRHQSEQHPARQFQHQWQLQSQHWHNGHPHAAAAARMSVIDQIKNGKANVKTNLLPDGSLRISALETIEAMEHFQWIAEEAIGAAQLSGRYLLPIPTVVVTILP